jgi:hypothetical protein
MEFEGNFSCEVVTARQWSIYRLMYVVVWSVRREGTAGDSGKERSMAAIHSCGLSVDRAGTLLEKD